VSDVETAAAPEVAATTEAPAPVETVESPAPQEINRNMSRRDRVNAMRDRLVNRGVEVPRGADGRYISQEAASQAASEEPVAVEEAATTEADSAAVEVAESGPSEDAQDESPSVVTIPLDPSHPLYDQGIKELTDVPAHLERAMRTMANASVRRQEVEHARAAQQAAESELAMQRARMELLQSGELSRVDSSPEIQALLKDVENTYPEQAETVKAAFEALQSQAVHSKETEVQATVEREQIGRRFLTDVTTGAAQQYPVWAQSGELTERMRIAVAQYGDYVDARNSNLSSVGQQERMPTSKEFFDWVDTNYVKDPRVQTQLSDFQSKNNQKVADNSAKEAVAAERKKLALEETDRMQDAAHRHSTKPPSPPAMRSQGTVVNAGPPNEEARRNHGTRQRDLRASIRQRLQQSST